MDGGEAPGDPSSAPKRSSGEVSRVAEVGGGDGIPWENDDGDYVGTDLSGSGRGSFFLSWRLCAVATGLGGLEKKRVADCGGG